MKNINQIKASHFTTKFPTRSKFKMGELVRLRKLDHTTHPALKRYGAGMIGRVVGMNYKKGNYMRVYPYYVRFPDGCVFPIKSAYLEYRSYSKSVALEHLQYTRRQLRQIVTSNVRKIITCRGGYISCEDYRIIDKAIKKIRKLYE